WRSESPFTVGFRAYVGFWFHCSPNPGYNRVSADNTSGVIRPTERSQAFPATDAPMKKATRRWPFLFGGGLRPGSASLSASRSRSLPSPAGSPGDAAPRPGG
ncbi:hypothetical protein EJ591_13500, partial [Pseudomonas aeruginosa]